MGSRRRRREPRQSRGGQAVLLCAFFGRDTAAAQVEAILHPSVHGPLLRAGISGYDQHWALAEALEVPPGSWVEGYESLGANEVDPRHAFGGAPLIETP